MSNQEWIENQIKKVYNNSLEDEKKMIKSLRKDYFSFLKFILNILSLNFTEGKVLDEKDKLKFNVISLEVEQREIELRKKVFGRLDKDTEKRYKQTFIELQELARKGKEKGINTSFYIPNLDAAEFVKRYPLEKYKFQSSIFGNYKRTSKILKDALYNSLVKGESVEKVIQTVKDKVEMDERSLRQIIRTETSRANSQSLLNQYKESDVKEVIWSDSTESIKNSKGKSSKVCKACNKLNGKVFKIENTPKQPLHPNCRCTFLSVEED